MEQVPQSGADRITNLPADVIKNILVFLPIKDAAKTSMLSSKWRHHWRSIPQLVYDEGFAKIPVGYASESRMMSKHIILNIYKSLLLHDGPITKFVLCINGLYPFNDEMDLITLYISNKGVQHLALLNYHRFYDSRDSYKMHSSLFSALHLKSLRLHSCVFTPPTWFAGFSNLTHLLLQAVTLPYDFFESFLPKCPMLERLKIIACRGLGKLEIVAPALKSLHISGSSLDICFKCTPVLSDVSLYLSHSNTPDMVSLFASLPALRDFHIDCDILKSLAPVDGNLPTRLPTLHQLKVLDIDEFVFGCPEVDRGFVRLIMSSPSLSELYIQVSDMDLDSLPANSEDSSILKLLEVELCHGSSDCLQYLRQFKIDYSFDQRFNIADDDIGCILVEPELVRFVLATAPRLQRLHIVPPGECRSKIVMKFMKDVMRYKRISKEAEVIYDSDEEVVHDVFLD